MAESTLPLIGSKSPSDSKPQRSPVEAFCAANAWKLIILLVLFLTGCLGFGVKTWLDNKETTIDLSKIVSSHQVIHSAGDSTQVLAESIRFKLTLSATTFIPGRCTPSASSCILFTTCLDA